MSPGEGAGGCASCTCGDGRRDTANNCNAAHVNGASPTTAPLSGPVVPDEVVSTVVTGTVVAPLVVTGAVVTTGPVVAASGATLVAGAVVAETVVAANGVARVVVGADTTGLAGWLAVASFADPLPHPASTTTRTHAKNPRSNLTSDDPNAQAPDHRSAAMSTVVATLSLRLEMHEWPRIDEANRVSADIGFCPAAAMWDCPLTPGFDRCQRLASGHSELRHTGTYL